jgi:UDP-N-acetylmuramoylalanine--D-glutamate ligase
MRNAILNTLCAAPHTAYNFTGKKVLVMGLGRFGGGVDVAEFAARAGARVVVTDLASAEQLNDSINKLVEFSDIEFHFDSHNPADFEQADIVIANPAVPNDNEFLELARQRNKFVTSQINIFFELCPAKIIGITGANGKSTTAALTAHLLENAKYESVIASGAKQSQITQNALRNTRYEDVWLSGNIGNQPLLMMLEKIKADDLVVLELSSFQLEQLALIKKAPKVALLTNLTPNHLDRYGIFDNYCAAKENIFSFQHLDESSPAVSVFNGEDEISAEWFEKYKNNAGRLCINFSTSDVSEEIRDSFTLPGRANLSNLAAAMAIARHFGVGDKQVRNCLPDFKALPHRLELVEKINGVNWYNDSKATTPKSAVTALEAFDEPVIIIAGGYDKNLPFNEIGQKIAEKAKAAILIGQTAPKIADAIQNAQMSLRAKRSNLETQAVKIELVNSLTGAVELANKLAEPDDVVLLSPACASYDMFENFEQRGNEFIRLVRNLGS